MPLTDQTVLLTGATAGIGAATARALAPQVGHLIVHDPQPQDEVAELLAGFHAPRLTYLQGDYGRLADVLASQTHESATLALDDLDLAHGYSPVRAYAQSKLAIVT